MAFSEQIVKSIDKTLDSFISKLATKFSLNETDIRQVWTGVSTPTLTGVAPLVLNPELAKLTKPELSAHCKSRGLKTTGTKQELLDRLTGTTTNVEKTSSEKPLEKPKATPKKVSMATPIVQKTIQTTIPVFALKKNSHGNYQHEETGFVFDKKSKEVVGKQHADGNVMPLTDEDIEVCHKFKFAYVVPVNLGSSNKKVVIDELEEEDESQIGEVYEEEEELLEEEEDLPEEDEEILEEDD